MIQILMPIAGSGTPFQEQDRHFPKSLNEVLGHPLIEYAINSATPTEPHKFIFVVRREDNTWFHISDVLHLLTADCAIIESSAPTAGSLCSALLAIDEVDPAEPLIVCNGDQYLPDGIGEALADFRDRKLDVGILTFDAVHPRWSFALVGPDGLVIETAEKRPISRHATCGLYFFRTGQLFLDAAHGALLKNYTYNEQFYVCPSINHLILQGLRVGIFPIPNDRFYPLGTPSDVEQFKAIHHRSPLEAN